MCSRKTKKREKSRGRSDSPLHDDSNSQLVPDLLAPRMTAPIHASASTEVKLEITCHPESVTFRDEGGRLNYLFLYFVMRPGPKGLPKEVAKAASPSGKIKLRYDIEYESGGAVLSSKQGLLAVYGNAGTARFEPSEPTFDCKSLRGAVRFRILKLSRNHDGRRFRIRVGLDGIDDSVVASCVSDPISVLSKRKRSNALRRGPEGKARRNVELKAESESIKLSEACRSIDDSKKPGAELRETLAYDRVEKEYPCYDEDNDDGSSRADSAEGSFTDIPSEGLGSYTPDSKNESSAENRSRTKRKASDDQSLATTPTLKVAKLSSSTSVRNNASAVKRISIVSPKPLGKIKGKKLKAVSLVSSDQTAADNAILLKMIDKLGTLQQQLKSYMEVVTTVRKENEVLREKVDMLERCVNGDEGSVANTTNTPSINNEPFARVVPAGPLCKDLTSYLTKSLGAGATASPPPALSGTTASAPQAPPVLPRSHSLAPAGDGEEEAFDTAIEFEALFAGPNLLASVPPKTHSISDSPQLAT